MEFKTTKREVLLNGKKVEYDIKGRGNLLEAKKDYNRYIYIGSSHIYYINGTENLSKELGHYFKRKS